MIEKISWLLALTLFSLLFLPSWLFQAVLITQILLVLISYAWAMSVRAGISVSREQASIYIEAGQPVSVVTRIAHTSRFPLHWASISDISEVLYFSRFPKVLTPMKPRSELKLHNTLRGYRRGVYTVGPVSMSGSDPLGIFPWERSFPETKLEIIIYPEVLPFPHTIRKGATGGPAVVRDIMHEDQSRYRGMRDYQPGDPMRYVNWKASARHAQLQTMEYSQTLLAPVCIVLNLTAAAYPSRHRYGWMERAVTGAASAAAACIAGDQPVGFYANGVLDTAKESTAPDEGQCIMLQQDSGSEQAHALLAVLAAITPHESALACSAMLTHMASALKELMRIYYFGPIPSPDELKILTFLRQRGYDISLFTAAERPKNAYALRDQGFSVYPLYEHGEELYFGAAGRMSG